MTAADGGGNAVHLPSGDSLALSTAEVIFLARAAAGGLDPSDPQVRQELEKFVGFRVLAPEQLAPARHPAAPSPPTPARAATDPAPKFRCTLKLSKPEGAELYDVQDPKSGYTFQLHDFELSLARLLDGRRPLAEVLESAARLGIPLDLDAVNQFIRHLERCGLVALGADAVAVPGEGKAMWGPRRKWADSVRSVFRTGLRMHRQGHYPQAVGHFQTLLAQDPIHPEALDALAQSQRQLPSREASRAADEASDAPTIVAPLPFPDLVVPVEAEEGLPPDPSKPEQVTDAHPALAAKPPRPLVKGGAATVLVLCALAVGWVYLRPQPVPPVLVPLPPVARVAEVVTPDASSAEVEPEVAVEADEPTVTGGVAAGELDAAQWVTFKIQVRGRVTMGELVAARDGVLSWKAAPEQRVRRNERVGSVGGAPLVAPAVGLVIPNAPPQAEVKQAQVVGSILYFEAYLKTVVTGIHPEPGWRCEVVSEATKNQAPCKIGSVVPRGAGFFVTATTEPRWFDEATDAVVRLAPHPGPRN